MYLLTDIKPGALFYDSSRVREKCPHEWCKADKQKLNLGMFHIFWDTEIQLVSADWMRNTACSPIPCSFECCHPEEQSRPLVGEGWVAAGPLRGLFLQGHTHAWSEAHRGGSGTHRDSIRSASLLWFHTTHPRGPQPCDWAVERQSLKTRSGPADEHVFFSNASSNTKTIKNWKLRGSHSTRRFSPFQVDLSEVSKW